MLNQDGARNARKRLADEFRRHRKSAGLSQTKVAERLGITYQQIGKYERGESEIPAHRMDIARSGFKPDPFAEPGFAEESSGYTLPPIDRKELLTKQWPQLKGQIEQFVRTMDDLAAFLKDA